MACPGGAEYHDYQHYVGGQSHSNFASVFTCCDYIYGTDMVSEEDPYEEMPFRYCSHWWQLYKTSDFQVDITMLGW
ncbi:unnamed protein product [Prunus armeniaca]|uniref:Uncharacterized protein n=1 Tax=Prunus armeniaca TaxID=36596 RepID=A0A6J5UUG5_PRUAR|nr:unnamed protein product [Prunus armeniaca]CAB4310124.1 unnamed protein product [Prunus armeniaca]